MGILGGGFVETFGSRHFEGGEEEGGRDWGG